MTAKVACFAHITDVFVIGACTSHVICINIETSKHVAHLPFRLQLEFALVKASIEGIFCRLVLAKIFTSIELVTVTIVFVYLV